jgi:uncharacterized heparinase superfamily protein
LRQDSDGSRVRASHDGFSDRFGLLHERTVDLWADGEVLEGIDRLVADPNHRRARKTVAYALRFHLHPSVRASRVQDGRAVLLIVASRGGWLFSAGDGPIDIEESIFLAGNDGPRRSEQLVLHGSTSNGEEIAWRLERAGGTGRRRGGDDPAMDRLL